MALNFFAFLAIVAITVSEIAVGTTFRLPEHWQGSGLLSVFCLDNLRLARTAFCLAVLLLLLAGHVAYFFCAVISAALLLLAVLLLRRLSSDGFIMNKILRVVAGAVHIIGLWILPFCILWNLSDSYSDVYFVSQEVGHFVPSTFYVVGVVVLPLLMLPGSYQLGGIEHQMMESTFNFGSGIIYFIIFRTAHHFGGEDPKTGMSAPNWDHELLGIIWCFSGLVGLFYAYQGVQTSLHIFFPAVWVAYSMIAHSASANVDEMEDIDLSMDEMKTWMKLHMLHGMAFGGAALCRLFQRLPESIFLFFMGGWIFVFSAMSMVKWLGGILYNHKFDHYAVDHVAALVVVTSGVVFYPAHLAALTQMRKALDQPAPSMGFTALSTYERDGNGTCAMDFDDGSMPFAMHDKEDETEQTNDEKEHDESNTIPV